MEVLRITFTQNQANYRKEESITNKMTYPLPPFSTVIGAIHQACGFTTYHPMDLSIQGGYQSFQKEPYRDYGFLNSVMDDRGVLIKLKNPLYFSTAYEKVAKALKGQGNSFRNGITIEVYNEVLLEEYRGLLKKRDEMDLWKKNEMDPQIKAIDEQKKALTTQQKGLDKKSEEFLALKAQITELTLEKKALEQSFKQKKEVEFNIPYAYFSSLTTSLRYYEVLYGVKVVVHISSDPDTLATILDHVYELKSVGRSEDFVEIIEAKMVNLTQTISHEVASSYSAYLAVDLVKNEDVILGRKSGVSANGTRYSLNKNYEIIGGKRIFVKKPVVYCANYKVDQESRYVYLDDDQLIVNLI